MSAYWKRLSIRKQFLALGILFLMVLSLLLGITNAYMTLQVENNFISYILEGNTQIDSRLTGYSEQMHRFMVNLAFDPVVQDFLAAKTRMERFTTRQLLLRRLSQATGITDGVLAIVVRPMDGNPTSDSGVIGVRDIMALPEPEGKKTEFLGMQTTNDADIATVVTLHYMLVSLKSFSVRSGARTNTELGTVFMLLDGKKMARGLGILPADPDAVFFLLDEHEKVIHSNRLETGTQMTGLPLSDCPEGIVTRLDYEGIEYYAGHLYNRETRMHLLTLTPRARVLADVKRMFQVELVFFLVLVAFLVLVFLSFLYSAVLPLSVMGAYLDAMRKKLGRRTEPLILHGNREAEMLADSFNRMLDTTESLNRQIIESEIYKRHSEIARLRSQINPHFLYNTLETIKGMAFAGGNPGLVSMVGSLSKVYRYSVKGAEFVQLREELAMLDDYLGIQQVRFPGRYTVEHAFPEDTLDCLLPRMLLQPLVENALQHGLEMRKTGGVLSLSSRLLDGDLVLSVQDNGVGIEEEVLTEMQRELTRDTGSEDIFTASHVKIGVLNVHGRLRRYYGTSYGLTVESRPGLRTTVTVRLPEERGEHVPFVDRR